MAVTAIVQEAEPELLKLNEHLALESRKLENINHLSIFSTSNAAWLQLCVWDNALDRGYADTYSCHSNGDSLHSYTSCSF